MASLPDSSKLNFKLPKKVQTICFALIGVGILLTLIQLVFPGWHAGHAEGEVATGGHAASKYARMWMSIHLASLIAFPLGIGGVFFAALSHIVGAQWSITTRRLTETFFLFLIIPLCMMILVFIGGMGDVFGHWVHAPATDHIIAHKAAWLNVPFFVIRNIAIVLIWMLLGWMLWKKSIAQDKDGDIGRSRGLAKLSAVVLIIFGLTYSIHAFDLGMSLEPHWFSTLFAIYIFSGMILTLFSAIILWVTYLKKHGYYENTLNENHFHDYGKYMFGFTVWWAYMAISQYLLIWYAGIPEETGFYYTRLHGGWFYVSWAVSIIRFVIPFFLLLKREVKRKYNYMSVIAVIVIIGQILDIYLIAYPTLDHGHFIMISWQEIGPLLFVAGSFILIVGKGLERAPLIPVKDPRLEDCLHFHQ